MSRYLSDISALIKTAIRSDDEKVLKAIIGPLFDSVSEESRLPLIEMAVKHAIEYPDLAIKDFIIDTLGMPEDVAYDYISSHIKSFRPTDPTVLSLAVKSLGVHYPAALLEAILNKQVSLALDIAEAHDYQAVEIQQEGREFYLVDEDRDLIPLKQNSNQRVKLDRPTIIALFDLMTKCGLDKLINVEPYTNSHFLSATYFSRMIPVMKTDLFSHPLPVLSNHKLVNPELAIALSGHESSYPYLYERIACWIHRDVTDLPDNTTVFEKRHVAYLDDNSKSRVILGDQEPDYVDIYSSDLESKLFEGRHSDMSIKLDIGYALAPADHVISSSKLIADSFIIKNLVTERDQLGLNQPDDLRLCVMDVKDLLSYPAESVDPNIMENALEFVQGYMPLDVLLANRSQLQKHSVRLRIGNTSCSAGLFMKSMTEPGVRDEMLKAFPSRSFWVGLLQEAVVIEPEIMLLMRDTFGIDNREVAYKVQAQHVDALNELGFRFHPEGHQVSLLSHSSKKPDLDFAVKFIRMGGWPYTPVRNTSLGVRPSSIEDAIEKYISRGESECVIAYLLASNVEDVVKTCKKDHHFDAIMAVYGKKKLEPHMHLLSPMLRGMYLSDGLGL